MTQQIPKTLLQLIEHIELNKSGWWDSALNNVDSLVKTRFEEVPAL